MSMFCTNCGTEIAENVNFCPVCGKNITVSVQQPVYVIVPPVKNQPIRGRVQGIISMIIGFVNCYCTFIGLLLFVSYLSLDSSGLPHASVKIYVLFFLFISMILSLIAVTLGTISRRKNYKRQSTVGLICGYCNFALVIITAILLIIF